ncbi:hypothetical protein [Nocardia brasiliensis]|uniref:hypothetical protein n=1 Tax=Nocardia brasiliensis TaxID=37326 RepID=UPI00366B42A2
MKSRTRSGLFGIAAISCLAETTGAAPAAFAAPNTPSDKLCTITDPVPDGEFTVEASSDVFAVSGNNGSFDLTLHTEPGRIALVLGVSNNDGGQNYTNGDCSVEYQVR